MQVKTAQVRVAKPYDKIYTTKKTTIIMYSPRISGKSLGIGQAVYIYSNKYPKNDIVVTRANYNALEDTIYNEIISYASDIGDTNYYIPRKSPLKIRTRHGNTIFFKGIGGSDYSRSKGFKGVSKLSLIVCDETQQLKDEQSLLQAKATFTRSLDATIPSRVIFAGNPEMVKAHWWNVFCKKYRASNEYEFIDANYLSIKKFLSPLVLNDIEIEKKYNPLMYEFLYLGNINDLSGSAYPQFKRDKHFISVSQWREETKGDYIAFVIWGGDGAIKKDGTGITPIAIMGSGRGYVLERFYYNPSHSGVILAPSQIVALIKDYVADMDYKYGISESGIGSCFAIDCASSDLITQLNYEINNYHMVKGFTEKNIINNNAVVNDAFAKNVIKIVDFGGYYDYYKREWIPTDADSEPLVYQLESVVWKNDKFDASIENDYSDALTYGINMYYNNPENLRLPERRKFYES